MEPRLLKADQKFLNGACVLGCILPVAAIAGLALRSLDPTKISPQVFAWSTSFCLPIGVLILSIAIWRGVRSTEPNWLPYILLGSVPTGWFAFMVTLSLLSPS
jgi:drug/metabolite transporter (DMT)-like permease